MVRFSERLYGQLLLLYPRAFRREYGPAMTQLFRDQCRMAEAEQGNSGVARFWCSQLRDLAFAAVREHAAQVRRRLVEESVRFQRPSFATSVACVSISLLIGLGSTALLVSRFRPMFVGLARVEVNVPEGATLRMAPEQWNKVTRRNFGDPSTGAYYVLGAAGRMLSEPVLRGVIDRLALTPWLAARAEPGAVRAQFDPFPPLLAMVRVHQMPRSTMLEVRVECEDAVMASRIANAIVEESRSRFATVVPDPEAWGAVRLVDPAEPPKRPAGVGDSTRITMGILATLFLAAGSLALVSSWKGQRPATPAGSCGSPRP
ncbi:MAG TPA: hypothetical protein VHH73_11310 [Verrucomicrobiae bacterium]|nr:hypothetical protein [Verrucomicrobiae bacterium]